MGDATPIMEQYFALRKENPDTILFFQVGDFFETFDEDARLVSRELEITLTSRQKNKNGEKIPLAGVPCSSVGYYINKLIKKGYKIAICEQVEDASVSKGIVKREITRIVTPGICVEENILENTRNNYTALAAELDGKISLSIVDVSTGEFFVKEYRNSDMDMLYDDIAKYSPSEIVAEESIHNSIKDGINRYGITLFIHKDERLFQEKNIEKGFDAIHKNINGVISDSVKRAIGGLAYYIFVTNPGILNSISEIRTIELKNFMQMDKNTISILGIIPYDDGDNDTLLRLIDRTTTKMGVRLLENWLLHPLIDRAEIENRQTGVEYLISERDMVNQLKSYLKGIYDIERIAARISTRVATPRGLVNLKKSLKNITLIKKLSEKFNKENNKIVTLISSLTTEHELTSLLEASIVDEPSSVIKDGNVIKAGYNKELESLKNIENNQLELIRNIEVKEQQRTGIKNLRIGYNTVFGYYIEISKSYVKHIPPDYVRKQTIANGERFITSELKEIEQRLSDAKERSISLEMEIYRNIIENVASHINEIKKNGKNIAEIDVLISLAEVSYENGYVKPVITTDGKMVIRDGRHPVIDKLMKGGFVPNNTDMDVEKNRIMILTGPNMAGKTTYMRQIALITVMAQVGSYVPAKYASIPIITSIFTRSGSRDNITKGESSFMSEMADIAYILKNADRGSLILLDEVGRGTSTFDGMSIAWAIVEYINNKSKCMAIVATHYHQLTEIALYTEGISNYHLAIKEDRENIIFLRKVVPGSTDKSYGIHVAILAKLPYEVIQRAKAILSKIEKVDISPISSKTTNRVTYTQMVLLPDNDNDIVKDIDAIDTDNITPIEALIRLKAIKDKIRGRNNNAK
ncbi:MAG: DNA mismatch repair protein MutS [Candidatus Thermoplasmatota archaeon]|nr:DNA mismatch repair protein MutS [Candidatus Thermoplasmatota archaeon]MCL5963191.1 DNA mismatch repair protein MutS [Candidatus Thermoplasmatota archaeon]